MFYLIEMRKIKRYFLFLILIFSLLIVSFLSFKLINFFRYIDLITIYSTKNGLDPAFVSAIIETESKFKKDAVSHKGASGLMQITEPTAIWVAELMHIQNFSYSDIFDPEMNIKIGTFYLKMLLNSYNNNKQFALIAYNAGSGNLYRWRNNKEYSKDGSSLNYIPFEETRNYIIRVEEKQKKYRIIYKIIAYLNIGGTYE